MKTKKDQATPAAATPEKEALPIEAIADNRVLYIAFELGKKQWKLFNNSFALDSLKFYRY